MKLAIGINIFGCYKRQDHCIEVLNKLVSKYTNDIELYNITFENEKNYLLGFKHLPLLKRTAKDVALYSISNKPIAKDFFDILSEQDCDYFLFVNSDIMVTEKLIKLILKGEYETYCVSRHDVYEINDLSVDKIMPFRIEIAGFDAWAVKKDWWIKNRDLFDDYIYAEALWDVFFSVQMYNNSNCILCNKDVYLAHEKHELKWNEFSAEHTHNEKLWKSTPYHERWHKFIYDYLTQRPTWGHFLYPLPDELEKEKEYLKIK